MSQILVWLGLIKWDNCSLRIAKRKVTMLKKGLQALKIIALHGEMSTRELAEAMGMPKSTAHRLVASLVDERLLQVARRADSDVYTLGSLIGELSGAAFMWRPVVQHARAELTAARDDTGETCGIHMLYGDRRVLLDQVVSQHPLRWVYGHHMSPMPLTAGASGKMFLAMLDADERDDVLRRTDPKAPAPERKRKLAELLTRVEQTREQGYAVSADELNPGITSIAVPVMPKPTPRFPRVVLSLAAPSIRVDDKVKARHIRRLLAGAGRIRARLRDAT